MILIPAIYNSRIHRVSGLSSPRYVRYVFYCGYGPFSWRIQCRFSEVELLRNRLARSLQTDSSRGGDSTPCPHAIGLRAPTSSFTMLPQWHETRPAFLSQRHGEIMAYLQGLAGTEAFWKHRAVKEFFEVRKKAKGRNNENTLEVLGGGSRGFSRVGMCVCENDNESERERESGAFYRL